jgi:hypothetical protein
MKILKGAQSNGSHLRKGKSASQYLLEMTLECESRGELKSQLFLTAGKWQSFNTIQPRIRLECHITERPAGVERIRT